MSGDAWVGIGTFASGLLLFLGGIFRVRKTLQSSDGKDRYDQLQEDLEAERTARINQNRELNAELAQLRHEVTKLQAAVRIRDDYIVVLRKHIEDGQPPPPPPYPSEMGR